MIEFSAYGALLARDGTEGPSRHPRTFTWLLARTSMAARLLGGNRRGDRRTVAALRRAMGEPAGRPSRRSATPPAGGRGHDLIDVQLQEWCRACSADILVERLWDAGVPVGRSCRPTASPSCRSSSPAVSSRRWTHPVIGPSRYSTLPVRFSRGPEHVHRRHAPLLGEHNAELLGELGLAKSEIDGLEADGIIGGTLVSGS